MNPAAEAVRAFVLSFWIAHTPAPYFAEALTQHAWLESRFEPSIEGRSGSCLLQWTGTRLRDLRQFSGSRRCPDLLTQLAWAGIELKTVPEYSCFWRARSYGAALAALRRGFGRGRC